MSLTILGMPIPVLVQQVNTYGWTAKCRNTASYPTSKPRARIEQQICEGYYVENMYGREFECDAEYS
ncbi:MAG: hypothetical protein LPH21_18425 [Shewanella sp.]|nr:hypothetical protein [Shewanella sp.]